MDQENLSREDLLEWTENPITKLYMLEVNSRLKELHLALGSGRTLRDQADTTAIETAKLVGGIEELQNILDIDFLKE